jgi:hypothetical protein
MDGETLMRDGLIPVTQKEYDSMVVEFEEDTSTKK